MCQYRKFDEWIILLNREIRVDRKIRVNWEIWVNREILLNRKVEVKLKIRLDREIRMILKIWVNRDSCINRLIGFYRLGSDRKIIIQLNYITSIIVLLWKLTSRFFGASRSEADRNLLRNPSYCVFHPQIVYWYSNPGKRSSRIPHGIFPPSAVSPHSGPSVISLI